MNQDISSYKDKIILTGDRPTGHLHLGHYVGSISNRLILQENNTQYIMIADVQALTDNFDNSQKVKDNVFQVACDYLSVGIDPNKSTIFIQSAIPTIAELTIFYLNLVTVNRLKRNPTLKSEILQKGFGENMPVGFFAYPISQAADITFVKAELVPVGIDQLPMIEQTNEIVRSFNRIYNCNVLVESKALISKTSKLPGIDGKAKMSKSLGNAIFMSDSSDIVAKKVKSMYTDPNHIYVSDPGQVEGNTVFTYLDVFDHNKQELQELKEHYTRGGLADMVLKKRLTDLLNEFLEPIRTKRKEFEKNPEYVFDILKIGSEKAESVGEKILQEVKSAMKINYFMNQI